MDGIDHFLHGCWVTLKDAIKDADRRGWQHWGRIYSDCRKRHTHHGRIRAPLNATDATLNELFHVAANQQLSRQGVLRTDRSSRPLHGVNRDEASTHDNAGDSNGMARPPSTNDHFSCDGCRHSVPGKANGRQGIRCIRDPPSTFMHHNTNAAECEWNL
jgi:hypothetical protein